ncbi:MAG: DUF3822 family protein [Flavobacteriales bacterium]|nr:DUF3822 family protein [Flavobacteriales bacterium]
MDQGSWMADGYEPSLQRAWHLSLLVADDLRAWCVQSVDEGIPMAIRWSRTGAAFDAEDLPLHPASVSFVSLPEWSALVPEGALERGSEASHLSLVHGRLPTGALRDEPITDIGARCIYVHDDELERHVLDRFPGARPVPMSALMLRGALSRSATGPVLLIHRGHDRLDAAVADKGRLLLCNTYPARSSQDLLYYALLAAEGCGLTPSSMQVEFGGYQLVQHEVNLLSRYFGKPSAATGPWHNAAHEGDPWRWLALTEQFACVS